MAILNDWIDKKLAEIGNVLPSLVNENPRSFSCGYTSGYKRALLDIENYLTDILKEGSNFEKIYKTSEQILEEMGW